MSSVSAVHLSRPVVDKVKVSLRYATVEGMAYGAFVGFGEHFIGAFAVALQANSLAIGVLSALPGLLASFAQLAASDLVRIFKSRKAVVLVSVFAQGLIFVPLVGLALLPPANPAWWLILFMSLYSIFGACSTPAWASLMAELVPDSLRGKYFSVRGRFSTLATVLAFLAGGVFLHLLVDRALWGFAVVFAAALAFRLISWGLLTHLYEAPLTPATRSQGDLLAFTRGLTTTNLGRYMLFLFAMSFSVNIAGPYFTVYLLRELEVSYLMFAVLHAVTPMAQLIAITHWGQAADRAGNLKMLYLASAMIPVVPLLWLASSNLSYLGAVQAFSGLAWAGFNLCSVNYIYDATTPANRTRYLAYFNAGNGLATGLGALTGGFLLPHLPFILGSQFLCLFMISGLMRGATAAGFLPFIKEVRRVSHFSAAELFHVMLGGRPVHRGAAHKRFTHLHPHEPSRTAAVPRTLTSPTK